MAAPKSSRPDILSLFLILIVVSIVPKSFSQSTSPQNIQTFYPVSPPPPPIIPPPPPAVGQPPPSETPPPGGSSTRAAVGRAVGLTAAGTAVLSALLFFFLLRRSGRKRVRSEEENNAAATDPPPADDFSRFNGNIKGVIVEEDGLDVLYWKNLEEGSFKKEYYNKELAAEEKRMVAVGSGGRARKSGKHPVHETPLLRGMSSTSQSTVWADPKDVQIPKREPSSSLKAVERQESLVQVQPTKHAPPSPPPPPIPTPPLPPPPRMAVAVGAAKTPLVSSSLKPPPPPNKRSSSLGEGTSGEQVKLKPLHWDKVNPNAVEHSMVWDKMDKGSFKFDGDLMEALFGTVATNRKSPQGDNRSQSPLNPNQGPPAQIFILDTHKSQNIAIVLKSLGATRKEIVDAIIQGQGLNSETIEKLTKIAPSDEEVFQITAFNGDPTRLADAESFLYHLLKSVPSAFTRFNAMLFRTTYDSEVSSVKQCLQSLELACNELRTRGLFLKLLEAVLKAGNRLNAGTSRGNAQAFNLTALRKLSDVRSSDGKTTLLEFVVQEVVRAEGKRCVLNKNRNSLSRTGSQSSNGGASQSLEQDKDDREREFMMLGLPVIGGLSSEFSNVKKAATLDYDTMVKSIRGLSSQAVETRELVLRCGDNTGFKREMNGFLDKVEAEMKAIREDEIRVMEIVKKTRDYYQAGSLREKGNSNMLQLFVMVRDFLGMVDQVCVDIARNVQRRKVATYVFGPSAAPETPRVFRFPKLPANFMSEHSQTGSSDSVEGFEAR